MRTILTALFLIPAASGLFVGCSSTASLVDKEFYSPDHPKYSIAVDKQGRKHGPEVWWHPNGRKKYEAENLEGVREGKFTAWHENGGLWYEGFDLHGLPESTLTYWGPAGYIKSKALFRNGIQLERRDYDDNGNPLGVPGEAADPVVDDRERAAQELAGMRKTSLNLWAMRVRQTVEGFWVLPKQFEKDRPYRAVANIKVGKDGRILGVNWIQKSPSSAFNTLAQNTFKRVKRLPAFPPQIKEESLEIQYEFISLGKPAPRKKLEAREPGVEEPEAGQGK